MELEIVINEKDAKVLTSWTTENEEIKMICLKLCHNTTSLSLFHKFHALYTKNVWKNYWNL